MIRWLLKLAVSLTVLAALIWWADAKSVAEKLRGADLSWLGVALISLTAITVLMARRWQIVAQALRIELPFSRAMSEYYLAQLTNLVLPGGVVGDVGRAYRARQQGDLVRAAQSVAAERLIGQISMLLVMAVGFTFALLAPGGIAWPEMAWLGVLAFVVVAAGAMVLVRRQSSTARYVRLILNLLKKPRLVGYTLMIAGLLIFSFYACARATGTVIPVNDAFTLVPLILSSMLIPLSIGGWGWREGAAAGLFPLIGASASAGIATGIAYGAMMMLAALPAVALLLRPNHSSTVPQN
ncbi:lysylphosphatidylglycerol synthase transmembrane domain-containing protein [Litoreibacter arenae]|uniref:Putative dolichol-P-glucose synthetase n=1 Tax=Litoreibacter arenae DSM 19593 TaxID=1123360 RepID=S9Q6V1_9RHOB|nr:lysylphosphatidylglycerol synthase transmembrane domain-containing protein [Litoreibacter arenae]EPX77081.1 putative dolichol-P-glucose synthetase [Litoreibacter arenae DSM 19593]